MLIYVGLMHIKGQNVKCDNIDQWIAEESDRGYWLMCVDENNVNIYENVVSEPRTIQNSQNIREVLRKELNIQSKYKFSVISKDRNNVPMTFQKQPFTIFEVSKKSDVKRIDPGKEKLSPGKIYILIEGGMWRWPPMRVGYKRELSPDFTLETLAVRPALFRLYISSRVRSRVSDILQIVKSRKMKRSQVSGRGGRNKIDLRRRSSYTSFVSYEESPALTVNTNTHIITTRRKSTNINMTTNRNFST